MKRFITIGLLSIVFCGSLFAQQDTFSARIENKEHDIFMRFNLYAEAIRIPGQDILGLVFGYLKKNTDSRVWIIMGAEIAPDGKKATLEMINDYGSEDLTAELVFNADSTYTLRQLSGSPIKVAGKNKWIKLPKTIPFQKTATP